MKNYSLVFAIVWFVAFMTGFGFNELISNDNNVGNGEAYNYEVTSIEGNEINGVALNKKSSDNAGIFLYANEIPFDVQVGDKIEVVWGEYEDEFISIGLIK